MEEIIKKAIEGGWKQDHAYADEKPVFKISVDGFVSFFLGDTKYPDLSKYDIVCDPLFWQALGKACGWGNGYNYYFGERNAEGNMIGGRLLYIHQYYALRFHEINLTEGWDKAVEYTSKVTRGTALVN